MEGILAISWLCFINGHTLQSHVTPILLRSIFLSTYDTNKINVSSVRSYTTKRAEVFSTYPVMGDTTCEYFVISVKYGFKYTLFNVQI